MEKPNAQSAVPNQNWVKQFLASGSRLREAIDTYTSIGLEVHLEPARGKDLACSECQPPQPSDAVEGWYLIYTRPKQAGEAACSQEDELWQKLW